MHKIGCCCGRYMNIPRDIETIRFNALMDKLNKIEQIIRLHEARIEELEGMTCIGRKSKAEDVKTRHS